MNVVQNGAAAPPANWEPRFVTLRLFRRKLGWVPAYLKREDLTRCLADLPAWAEEHVYLELAAQRLFESKPELAKRDALPSAAQRKVEKLVQTLRKQLAPVEANSQLVAAGKPGYYRTPASYLLGGLEECLQSHQYLQVSTAHTIDLALVKIRAYSRRRSDGAPVFADLWIATSWADIRPSAAGVKDYIDRHLYAAEELQAFAERIETPLVPSRPGSRQRRVPSVPRRPSSRPSALAGA